MKKDEMISRIAHATGESKRVVETVLASLSDVVVQAVKSGDEVTMTGVGKFKKVQRAARTARNPRTGENIAVPAHDSVRFQVAKPFKDALM